jgi:hypothetical protein
MSLDKDTAGTILSSVFGRLGIYAEYIDENQTSIDDAAYHLLVLGLLDKLIEQTAGAAPAPPNAPDL